MRLGEKSTTACVMASQRHRRQQELATTCDASRPPLSLSGDGYPTTGALAAPGVKVRAPGPAEVDTPGDAIARWRSGATKDDDKGEVRVRAATFMKGDQPHTPAAKAKAAALKTLRVVFAPPLFAPSGVAGAKDARGTEVEELMDRHRHARTALPLVVGR